MNKRWLAVQITAEEGYTTEDIISHLEILGYSLNLDNSGAKKYEISNYIREGKEVVIFAHDEKVDIRLFDIREKWIWLKGAIHAWSNNELITPVNYRDIPLNTITDIAPIIEHE